MRRFPGDTPSAVPAASFAERASTPTLQFPVVSMSSAAIMAIFGGILLTASFLDFALWPTAWLAFIPILLALSFETSVLRSVQLGFLAGFVTNVPAFAWLVRTIHLFGGFPLWLSTFFYLALSTYSAMEFVLLALALRRVGRGPASVHPALLWVTLEFLYPNLFPWRLANSQLRLPVLLQVGDLTGPFGLSFVMVWVASAAVTAIQRGPRSAWRSLLCSAVSLVLVLVYGWYRMPTIEGAMAAAPLVRLGLVQGNLSIEEKHDVRYLEGNLGTYRSLTANLAPPPDVVIWPESVITEALPRTMEGLSPLGREMLGLRAPLLAGAITFDEQERGQKFFNSVMLFDEHGRVLGLSDKQILMPFGEFMPLGSVLPWLKRISPQTGDFQAGTAVNPLEVPGVAVLAPLNCYEDLRAPIARRAVRAGGAAILVAVANDGWFGDTVAPFQHEALALWRAIENRRYLVRVTNTGVTDVIEPTGKVSLRLPVFQSAAAVAEVHRVDLRSAYTRFGDWFGWLATVLSVAVLLTSARSPDRPEPPTRQQPRG